MEWFNREYELFLRDLKENNDKAWFDANKARYETFVKQPFERFVTELIARMQRYDPNIRIQAKDAIFRIYRDVRFSSDKTPYKSHMSAIIGPNGRKGMSDPGMYIEAGYRHLRVYGGLYMPSTEQVNAIRQEILYNQDQFEACIHAAPFVKYFGELRGEKNKRLPPEYAEMQHKQPLIANKQFYYYSDLEPELYYDATLVDEIFKRYEASIPLSNFLQAPVQDLLRG